MLTVKLSGDQELIGRLQAMPQEIRAALLTKVTELAIRLEAKVKGEKLSGQVLNVRTGALRSGIFYEVQETPSAIIGRVLAPRNVPYAAIHEYGGTTKPHIIEPRKAKALAFAMAGAGGSFFLTFAKRVNHPGSKMPERSYLRSSLGEMEATIIEELTAVVIQTSASIKAGGL